jgi:hypothetical protein
MFVMSTKARIVAVFAAAALVAGWSASEGNAAPRCYSAVEGIATSTGLLGAGSAKARAKARGNWQVAARRLHGRRYANFGMAQDVRWGCKKGAILLAKCVVVAKPCRY